MSYTYQYAPESASRRPNVVTLPAELFSRRSTVEHAVRMIDQTIPAEAPRTQATMATVTDLATRRVVTPVASEAPALAQSDENLGQAQMEQDARAQIAALHSPLDTDITLTAVPQELDAAYYSNLEQAA